MPGIEDLLRRRKELLEEIDRQIEDAYARPVTLLFTDIVGSTEFFESAGDIAGRQMIQTHNDLLFPLIASHGGTVIKTIGDSIMASFTDPRKAVGCSILMQEALQAFNRDRGERHPLRVRMGLHYGRAVMEEKDLFGDMVNTAARVESKADGEEILISGSLKAEVEGPDLSLIYLGGEQVKGKKRKVDFYLVNWNRREQAEVLASWSSRAAAAAAAPAAPAAQSGHPPGSSVRAGSAAAPHGPAAPAVHPQRVVIHGNLDLRQAAESLPPPPPRGNPYLNRVMIPHPDMFFGREAVVKRIATRIHADRPQSISIVGERRIGKSSLLNFLFSPRTRLRLEGQPGQVLMLFVDFQQLRTLEEAQFLGLIFAELRKQLGERIELELAEDFEGMRFLCDAVARAGYRLVLLFDEFESVTKNDRLGAELYSFLRSLANNFPVSFVTASGRNLKDMCVTHQIADSPFFNIFTVLHLGLLREPAARALIREPSLARGIPLEPLAAQILSLGGLHPFFLQMACSAWFELLEAEGREAAAFRRRDAPREVVEVFREEAEPHFEYVLQTLPAREKEALRQLLAGQSPDPGALESLERRGYLAAPEQGGHAPFSEEFGRFAGRYLGRPPS